MGSCPKGQEPFCYPRPAGNRFRADSYRKHTEMRYARYKFESDIDMSLSNSSIGADAPAATFGKTAFADFASARYENE